jgi:phosphoribosylamine--glycine ligase
MLVAGGYPEFYEKGKTMTGWETVQNSLLFHAGTALYDEKIITAGGRVLAITSLGDDFQAAVANSLGNAERIKYEGKYYRKDIGFDL